jgi:hypothetical protein
VDAATMSGTVVPLDMVEDTSGRLFTFVNQSIPLYLLQILATESENIALIRISLSLLIMTVVLLRKKLPNTQPNPDSDPSQQAQSSDWNSVFSEMRANWAAMSLHQIADSGAVSVCINLLVTNVIQDIHELTLNLLGQLVAISEEAASQMLQAPHCKFDDNFPSADDDYKYNMAQQASGGGNITGTSNSKFAAKKFGSTGVGNSNSNAAGKSKKQKPEQTSSVVALSMKYPGGRGNQNVQTHSLREHSINSWDDASSGKNTPNPVPYGLRELRDFSSKNLLAFMSNDREGQGQGQGHHGHGKDHHGHHHHGHANHPHGNHPPHGPGSVQSGSGLLADTMHNSGKYSCLSYALSVCALYPNRLCVLSSLAEIITSITNCKDTNSCQEYSTLAAQTPTCLLPMIQSKESKDARKTANSGSSGNAAGGASSGALTSSGVGGRGNTAANANNNASCNNYNVAGGGSIHGGHSAAVRAAMIGSNNPVMITAISSIDAGSVGPQNVSNSNSHHQHHRLSQYGIIEWAGLKLFLKFLLRISRHKRPKKTEQLTDENNLDDEDIWMSDWGAVASSHKNALTLEYAHTSAIIAVVNLTSKSEIVAAFMILLPGAVDLVEYSARYHPRSQEIASVLENFRTAIHAAREVRQKQLDLQREREEAHALSLAMRSPSPFGGTGHPGSNNHQGNNSPGRPGSPGRPNSRGDSRPPSRGRAASPVLSGHKDHSSRHGHVAAPVLLNKLTQNSVSSHGSGGSVVRGINNNNNPRHSGCALTELITDVGQFYNNNDATNRPPASQVPNSSSKAPPGYIDSSRKSPVGKALWDKVKSVSQELPIMLISPTKAPSLSKIESASGKAASGGPPLPTTSPYGTISRKLSQVQDNVNNTEQVDEKPADAEPAGHGGAHRRASKDMHPSRLHEPTRSQRHAESSKVNATHESRKTGAASHHSQHASTKISPHGTASNKAPHQRPYSSQHFPKSYYVDNGTTNVGTSDVGSHVQVHNANSSAKQTRPFSPNGLQGPYTATNTPTYRHGDSELPTLFRNHSLAEYRPILPRRIEAGEVLNGEFFGHQDMNHLQKGMQPFLQGNTPGATASGPTTGMYSAVTRSTDWMNASVSPSVSPSMMDANSRFDSIARDEINAIGKQLGTKDLCFHFYLKSRLTDVHFAYRRCQSKRSIPGWHWSSSAGVSILRSSP